MVSLLSFHFSHFSKGAVSVPDGFGQSLLIAWGSLDPFPAVGVGAGTGGETTSEV